GVEAARAGDKEKARSLFQQVTDADENNERAWLWLATVTDDPQQKRIYIENVLGINPDNDRAQQMLMQMASDAKSGGGEIIPGISRRLTVIVGGGAVGLWLILMVIFVVIGVSRRNTVASNVRATEVAFAQQGATATQAEVNLQSTEVALEQTQTFFANETATVVAATEAAEIGTVRLPDGVPTLPPTWTPTVEVVAQGAGPTPTPLPALPAEEFQGALLVGWGGNDRLGNGFRPVIGYQLDAGTSRELGGDVVVTIADINPANGTQLVFTRYFPVTFDFSGQVSNLSGAVTQRLADAWEPVEFLLEVQQTRFSPDGTQVVFIAPTSDTGTDEIYVLDLAAPPIPGNVPLTRITNDPINYANPMLSPDNSRIVAIRTDPQVLDPGPDIVLINTADGIQQLIKEDGPATIERDPAFVLPDATSIVFSGAPGAGDGTFVITQLNIANLSAPARFIVRDPASNAIYPVFSPDGRYLAFASDRTGEYNIFIQDTQNTPDAADDTVFQVSNDNVNPNFPGGWYIPGAVAPFGPVELVPPVAPEATGE
ncbi:MAG: hypothetical protein AAF125_14640, partial [Chloroflexota bacterium]